MTEENKEKIGAKMTDGTIYAGISPDTHKPLYAMPEDAGVTMTAMLEDYWEMYTEIPADTGLTMDFNKAAKTVEILNKLCAYGHNDWRVPSFAEMDLLHKNKNEGALKGTFNEVSVSADSPWNTSLYWSSTPSPDNSDDHEYQYAYVKDFGGGPVELNCTVHDASVRFVRG